MALTRPHSGDLRKGRYSQPGNSYFLTTSVRGRRRLFTQKNHATIVLDAIRWLHSAKRFVVDAAVVMPDHLHVVGQLGDFRLNEIMHTLKSYTAHELANAGIRTPIWQDGYHDHGLRNNEDYRTKVNYLLHNPVRAELVQRVEDYPYTILPTWWQESD